MMQEIAEFSNKLQNFAPILLITGIVFIFLAAVNPVNLKWLKTPVIPIPIRYSLGIIGVLLVAAALIKPKTNIVLIDAQVVVYTGQDAKPATGASVQLVKDIPQVVEASLESKPPEGARILRVLLDLSRDSGSGRMNFSNVVVDQNLTRQGNVSATLTPTTEFNTNLRFVVVLEAPKIALTTSK